MMNLTRFRIRQSSGAERGRRSLIVVLVVSLITSAAFLLLIEGLPRQQQAAAQWIDHTLGVLNVATSLEADLATAIGEARGFIIDKKVDSNARFEAASSRLLLDLEDLWVLTADNAEQQSELDRIDPQIRARMQMLRDIIDGLKAGNPLRDPHDISQLLATGQALTERISTSVNIFKQREHVLLVQRRANARHIVRVWLGVSLGCGIMAAGSVLFVAALLVARNRESKHLADLRNLNAGLEERVIARNADLAASETGLRRVADDLLISETRYRLLAESTNDSIICAQLDLRRTYASPACRTVLGYEPEEMLADERTAAVHPGDAEAVYEALYPLTVGTSERALVTYRARHKTGRWIWVEATISLVRNQNTGEPMSLVSSLRDISERHIHAEELQVTNARLERLALHLVVASDAAERASRAKSRFLAGMSHELHTPLNGILGYAQLLRMEGGLTVGQAARVDAVLDAGRHLLEMIHCILDLSEIEIKGFALQPVDFDLHRLAGACLDLVRPAAATKALALSISIDPGVPLKIRADPKRLRQVLLNFLGNAVKFTTRGAVALRLFTTGDGGRLRLEVVDTGPGIPPELRRRLFQEFERLDTQATRTDEGAGLGLSVSAQLAVLMDGRVGHDDSPTGGSVFWLELPLVVTATAAQMLTAAMATDAGAAKQAPVRVLNVLVVDDIAMNREIASSFLQAAGHHVTCVEGGVQAVAAVAITITDFDIVLMDVRMPEMDGLEATRRIRAIPGLRGRVPIVALTAQAFADQVAECHDAGMDSHLAKPFDPDTLLAAVSNAATTDRPSSAARTGIIKAKPAAQSEGSLELTVFDLTAFERTTAFLAPRAVSAYLRDISDRGDALSRELQEPDALAAAGTALAEAAHALAGSAGMFGFERLASVGRHFERAVQTNATEVPSLAVSLSTTLDASLLVIRDRLSVGVLA